MPNIYFDLETAPLPREKALEVAPDFEPDARLKDPIKIAEDIEKKENKFLERCALDPLTGQIACFAWCSSDKPDVKTMDIGEDSEIEIIKFALDGFNKAVMSGVNKIVGFNIRGFDIPFLMRRAIILDIPIPPAIKGQAMHRYSEMIVDLLDVWLFGQRDFTGQSLKRICTRCGFGTKTDDGKHFSDLMQLDRKAALEYARFDVELTKKLANRMGF